MTWSVGEITIQTSAGPRAVAGWVNGHVGLDFRAVWPAGDDAPWGVGWLVTHLPSGYSMIGLVMGRESAIAIAEEISTWADWQHVDVKTAKFLYPKMAELRARLGPRWVPNKDMANPWGNYWVEVGLPQLVQS